MDNIVNLLTIDDKMIQSFASDPRFTALLPCLSVIKDATAKAGKDPQCQVCPAKRRMLERSAFGQARQCIARLRGESLQQFKLLVNARQIRITALDGLQRVTKYTLK